MISPAGIEPDDTFLFFFSGHGDQLEGTSDDGAIEVDELDECICMYDYDLPDNEYAELLDQLDAGLSVTVLDACNSGGLARDVITQPNRVVYASSEEDC